MLSFSTVQKGPGTTMISRWRTRHIVCENPRASGKVASRAPHATIHTGDSKDYIRVCRNCHVSAHSRDAVASSNASARCLDCHMPKRRAEDAVHVVLTGHYIQRLKRRATLLRRFPRNRKAPGAAGVCEGARHRSRANRSLPKLQFRSRRATKTASCNRCFTEMPRRRPAVGAHSRRSCGSPYGIRRFYRSRTRVSGSARDRFIAARSAARSRNAADALGTGDGGANTS
jgi:hypothetical protein